MDVLLRGSLFGRTLNWLTKEKAFPHPQVSLSAGKDNAARSPFDFTGPNDPDIPRNWPVLAKSFVMVDVMLLNFSFYAASAIFTSSIPLIQAEFGASDAEGTLGLSLFVIAYGIGPLIVSET